jgi:hypothetical protein
MNSKSHCLPEFISNSSRSVKVALTACSGFTAILISPIFSAVRRLYVRQRFGLLGVTSSAQGVHVNSFQNLNTYGMFGMA